MVDEETLVTPALSRTLIPSELPEEELRWSSVTLNEVLEKSSRLEATFFGLEGKHAREVITQCKYPITVVSGRNGLSEAFYPTRFKRILVQESDYPLILPSQITELNPSPKGYLSPLCKTDFAQLKAKNGQILLTRSGTIGNLTFVGKTLHGKTLSDDIIRITCKNNEDIGYLYAFLRTKIGSALVRTHEYGAVVSHIEPEHLESVPIPNPPSSLKKRIHELVVRSYTLRDESNAMLDKAEQIIYDALNLPPITQLHPRNFAKANDLRNYTTKLSDLSGRLDASYHVPIVDTIIQRLKKESAEVTTIGDSRISKRIILPGRFARVFVQEGQGVVYFTGKHILELDPSDKKYLAFARHAKRIREQLTIKENMLLLVSSGTLGKAVLVPKHWDGWTMTHDIIRIICSSNDIAGYLWVFIISSYGQELVRRYTYGSVVNHIEAEHIDQIPIPLLKDSAKQEKINRLALEANAKRTEAFHLEQEAIHITYAEVIHAQ